MRKTFLFSFLFALSLKVVLAQNVRQISYNDYLDKVHGGWVGKAIGLSLGVPMEYRETWPPSDYEYYSQIPDHFSDRTSGDDVYIPLLNQIILGKYGIKPTYEQIMHEWDTRFYSGKVWVSCQVALELYRAGIPAPKTGYPGYNRDWADMCSQIGTDNFGWSAPGMINNAIEMADFAAHVINWGVGADGGVFTAAMCSEAFFTSDIEQLIRTARSVLPEGSRFGEMVDDALKLYKEEPDWRMARQALARKYNKYLDPNHNTGVRDTGIGTLLGLLYGNGDFTKSMLIAQKCGWDSDCTSATVAGLIGTIIGYSKIDVKWTGPLHDTYENYCMQGLPRWMTFENISKETVEIGEKVILQSGGKIDSTGIIKLYIIPIIKAKRLSRNEVVSQELIDNNEKELAAFYVEKLKLVTQNWNSLWSLTMASFENKSEVLDEYMGRKGVLKVQPGIRGACLESTISLAAGKHHYLKLGVAHHPDTFCDATGQIESGSWNLEVQVDDKKIGTYRVVTGGGTVIWNDPQFDLSEFAGKTIHVKLIATQGPSEFNRIVTTSYWSKIEILTMDKPEPWR